MNPQKWQKSDFVFLPNGEWSWAKSFAYVPTPFITANGLIRVFYSSLDDQQMGRISFADFDREQPQRLVYKHPHPCLDLGPAGSFDEHGVSPSCVVRLPDRLLLFYFGWQRQKTIRYTLLAGLAESLDEGISFRRLSSSCLIAESPSATSIRSAPFAIHQHGKWHLWYVGGSQWLTVNGKDVPSYDLYSAGMNSLTAWQQAQGPIIRRNPLEFGMGRPFVLLENGLFRMWYSIRRRDRGYRLGYAESADGHHWQRRDDLVGLDVSPSGFDSEAVCFSGLVSAPQGLVMYYNGNGLGQSGFGVAIKRL